MAVTDIPLSLVTRLAFVACDEANMIWPMAHGLIWLDE